MPRDVTLTEGIRARPLLNASGVKKIEGNERKGGRGCQGMSRTKLTMQEKGTIRALYLHRERLFEKIRRSLKNILFVGLKTTTWEGDNPL